MSTQVPGSGGFRPAVRESVRHARAALEKAGVVSASTRKAAALGRTSCLELIPQPEADDVRIQDHFDLVIAGRVDLIKTLELVAEVENIKGIRLEHE